MVVMADSASLDPTILGYYNEGGEQGRLETDCRLEFLRTQELIERFLPPLPARILDVGGGAGIHAKPLLAAGYDVVLVDPVDLHIEQALGDGITQAEVGDARELRFEDGSFDVVFLLGPLYHLSARSDRVLAIREARRVVGPSGVVLAAVISRFASTFDGLHTRLLLDERFEAIVEHDVTTGQHQNPDATPSWFTTGYFHHPSEVRGEFKDAGCSVDEILAIEGPGSYLPDIDNWLDEPERREVLLRTIRRTEADPSLLGASTHLLVVSLSEEDSKGRG